MEELKRYIFVTLAIGVEYRYKVRTLLECVNTLTTGDFLVITDDVKELEEYVETYDGLLDKHRIKIMHITEVTSHDPWFSEQQFNFNLKFFPTKVAFDMNKYDMIVHVDADALLLGWNEDGFQEFINESTEGMIARFRNRPIEEAAIQFILQPKAQSLSLDLSKISASLPIEVFMFFKPSVPEFKKFMEVWEEMVTRCNGRGVNPFMEALEISYALSESKLPYVHILNYIRSFPVLHTFRYIHQNHIMRII